MEDRKGGSNPFDSLLSDAMDHKEKHSTPKEEAQKISDSDEISSEDVINKSKESGEIKVLGEGKVKEDNKKGTPEFNTGESNNLMRKKPFEDSFNNSNNKKIILWFSEINKNYSSLIGEKASKLGELYNKKFPVPPGFVITPRGCKKFFEETGIEQRIEESLKKINPEEYSDKKSLHESLERISKDIKQFITNSYVPTDLREEILQSYEDLHAPIKDYGESPLDILKTTPEPIFVSVRNSLTKEVREINTNRYDNFLNIKGNKNLISYIKECFSSLFNPDSLLNIINEIFSKDKSIKDYYSSIIVQKMIDSDKSGIIYSKNPSGNSENIIVKSVWGMGEGLSMSENGEISPDKFIVSPELEIIKEETSHKNYAITRNSGGGRIIVPLREKADYPSLSRYEAKRLSDFSQNIEKVFQEPQKIEFSVEGDDFYILQSESLSFFREKYEEPSEETQPSEEQFSEETEETQSPKEREEESQINEDVKEKEITESEIQENNQLSEDYKEKNIQPIEYNTNTETKIELDISPKNSVEVKNTLKSNAKSVGLLKIEKIIADSGKHPEYFSINKKEEDYEEIIFEGLSELVDSFEEVWIRTSDFKGNEYKNLEGKTKYEEDNPLLGVHGIRYGLNHPELLKSELRAIKRIADTGRKIGVLIPHITTINELEKVKGYMKEVDFENGRLGVIIGNPASIQLIKDFIEKGIKLVSLNMSGITQHILSLDKNNEELFSEKYDEKNPAITRQLSYLLRVCNRNNIPVNLAEQSESLEEKKKLISELIESGISSVTVLPEEAGEISKHIAKEEGISISKEEEENKNNIENEKENEQENQTSESNEDQNNQVKEESESYQVKEENEDYKNNEISESESFDSQEKDDQSSEFNDFNKSNESTSIDNNQSEEEQKNSEQENNSLDIF